MNKGSYQNVFLLQYSVLQPLVHAHHLNKHFLIAFKHIFMAHCMHETNVNTRITQSIPTNVTNAS